MENRVLPSHMYSCDLDPCLQISSENNALLESLLIQIQTLSLQLMSIYFQNFQEILIQQPDATFHQIQQFHTDCRSL